MRYAASAMFNTVYEAEGAARALRGADIPQLTLIARNACTREVLVGDLVTRYSIPYETTHESINVTDRLTSTFLSAIHAAGKSEDWFQRWLADDYVLVIAYVGSDRLDQARDILSEQGGIFYGSTKSVKIAFTPDGPLEETGPEGHSAQ